MTEMEKCMDDNWGRLYQAILDFNEPLSAVTNMLEFWEGVPNLTGSSSGALMPPLSDYFNWSLSLPVFGSSKTPISQLRIVPINTAAPLPQAEDDDAATNCREPLQPTRDIYSDPPAPGSDANWQQWLHAELYNSLCLREFSPKTSQ